VSSHFEQVFSDPELQATHFREVLFKA